MTTKEILESERFKELLKAEVKNALANIKSRRSPIDALKEKGLLSVEKLKDEFLKILTRESSLTSSQRQQVMDLVAPVWKRSFSELTTENKSEEKEIRKEKGRTGKGKVPPIVVK